MNSGDARRKFPERVLMVSADAFDIVYSINPHMKDSSGNLKKVNRERARVQWGNVGRAYEKMGFEIDVIPAHSNFPDMVFCANQTFPFLNVAGEKCVLLSHMHAKERKGEVAIFREWFADAGYKIFELESQGDLEGAGDLLWDHERNRVFAGYGYRTSLETLDEVEKIVGATLIRLELRDPRYYHLDTCLTVLNTHCASYVREAFTDKGLQTIKESFADSFEVDPREAETLLAGNAHCPNRRDIAIQSGCTNTIAEFRKRGFNVIEVDTSEFLKSGGSVFCMKQMIF